MKRGSDSMSCGIMNRGKLGLDLSCGMFSQLIINEWPAIEEEGG